MRRVDSLAALLAVAAALAVTPAPALAQTAGPAAWQNDLTPITAKDWNLDLTAHLLERAGFGGTPAEIDDISLGRFATRLPSASAMTVMIAPLAGILPKLRYSTTARGLGVSPCSKVTRSIPINGRSSSAKMCEVTWAVRHAA